MPGPKLMIDGNLSPTVILQQLRALVWPLPIVSSPPVGDTSDLANSECNAIKVGSVSAATPGRRNCRLGATGGFNSTAGFTLRAFTLIEPAIVCVSSFWARNSIWGVGIARALPRDF